MYIINAFGITSCLNAPLSALCMAFNDSHDDDDDDGGGGGGDRVVSCDRARQSECVSALVLYCHLFNSPRHIAPGGART